MSDEHRGPCRDCGTKMHGRHVGDPDPQAAHAGGGRCYRCYGKARRAGLVSVSPRESEARCAGCDLPTRAAGGICKTCLGKPGTVPDRRSYHAVDTSWHTKGACRQEDPELFYHPPESRGAAKARREDLAKRVCAECPVKALCLDQARANRETYGVWGGETEEERKAWLRKKNRKRVAA